MSNEENEFRLPAQLDAASRLALKEFLNLRRTQPTDQPVTVSALAWRRLDSLTLQLLLAAAADRISRGLAFELTQVPDAIGATLDLLGVRPDMLDRRAAQ